MRIAQNTRGFTISAISIRSVAQSPATRPKDSEVPTIELRVEHSNCIQNDHSPRPSLRPTLEDWVPFLSHLQASEKTLLSDKLISCEQERQAVQAVHVRLEDLIEICRGDTYHPSL
jgi:hypothetical protein